MASLTHEQQAVMLFVQVLAATLCQVDRSPDAQWTTAALHRYASYVLSDVETNQAVPEICLAHAHVLLELLGDAIDDLQAERLLEPFDPPDLEIDS